MRMGEWGKQKGGLGVDQFKLAYFAQASYTLRWRKKAMLSSFGRSVKETAGSEVDV
jgi:hypothetical protein